MVPCSFFLRRDPDSILAAALVHFGLTAVELSSHLRKQSKGLRVDMQRSVNHHLSINLFGCLFPFLVQRLRFLERQV